VLRLMAHFYCFSKACSKTHCSFLLLSHRFEAQLHSTSILFFNKVSVFNNNYSTLVCCK